MKRQFCKFGKILKVDSERREKSFFLCLTSFVKVKGEVQIV